MAELPDGTSVPPCCSNSEAVKIWTTINPHSRMAWNSDIPGQLEDDKDEEKPTTQCSAKNEDGSVNFWTSTVCTGVTAI
ncbi:uncharacterized protein CEXT_214851 [Caerostris extrusa]|uniref:Uncharacterized protein n=1 Tax=Caerostris extrusa TaxID=172846 RepID=A0AAV4M761_CAEEX|nr:uncharacterized protein CEXT_214851 [Caerostris extrusa]